MMWSKSTDLGFNFWRSHMKKTLLSLAMFGAFSSIAMAQSSVQLYGIIDLGVQHISGIKAGTATDQSVNALGSGVQSSSRIGLKGSEDLGGGMSAFFQAETGFCAQGGNTAQQGPGTGTGSLTTNGGDSGYCSGGAGPGFMSRLAIVGLKGGFGSLSLGRMNSPAYDIDAQIDPFGLGLTGSGINMMPSARNYPRFSQAMSYSTPSFGGITGRVAYAFGAQPGNNSAGRAYDAGLAYANGPIVVGLNYLNQNYIAAAALGTGVYPTASVPTRKVTQVYGSYNLGVVKLAAMYEQLKADSGVGLSIPITLAAGQPDLKYYLLGATIPVGPGSIIASYSQTKDSNTANSTAKQFALGYTYSLSKRTNLYTSYSRINNNSNSYFAVGTASDQFAGSPGQSSSGFALGIRHMF
jgi:predicted porin